MIALTSLTVTAQKVEPGVRDDLEPNADILQMLDFSHYNRPIYVNYTIVNVTMLFESTDTSSLHLNAFYSVNGINWSIAEFTETGELSESQVIFDGTIGPFNTAGIYYLIINASRGYNLLAEFRSRFTVEAVNGIVFLNFQYNVKTLSDDQSYIDVLIDVLGDDIKLGSVYASAEEQSEDDAPKKLNLKTGTTNSYRGTIGPINDWGKIIHMIFTANTSSDVQFKNSNYHVISEKAKTPEQFWTGKFPAILIGAVVTGAMVTIAIMNQRRAPKSFE